MVKRGFLFCFVVVLKMSEAEASFYVFGADAGRREVLVTFLNTGQQGPRWVPGEASSEQAQMFVPEQEGGRAGSLAGCSHCLGLVLREAGSKHCNGLGREIVKGC